MKKKTIGRILELAAEGVSADGIRREVGCSLVSVSKVLDGVRPQDEAHEPDQIIVRGKAPDLVSIDDDTSLQDVISMLRGSYIRTAINLTKYAARLEEVIGKLLEYEADSINGHLLQSLAMVHGITTTKQAELLRHLRDLEAEASDDLEIGWTVVVVEDE